MTPAAGLPTDASGAFTTDITVPSVSNGTYAVTAIDEKGNIASSTFTVVGSDVPEPTPEPTPAPTPAPTATPSPTATPTPAPAPVLSMETVVGIAVVVVVLIIVIVAVLLWKRK